jgi:hypothetical protein
MRRPASRRLHEFFWPQAGCLPNDKGLKMRKSTVSHTVLCVIALTGGASFYASTAAGAAARSPGKGRLVAFDAPGAATVTSTSCGGGCGTLAYANNDAGDVVGSFTDANVVPHGFVRRRDGHVVVFDAPGAGLGSGLDEGTVAYSINDDGQIAGQFQDASFVFHAFVRKADGQFTTFDAPGAGTAANQGTQAVDINNTGAIGGWYVDANGLQHGFFKDQKGISSFDPAGSVYTFPCEETCLNDAGELVGSYVDSTSTNHGFICGRHGAITIIDVPGAGTGGGGGTIVASINARHEIAGYDVDTAGVIHGFIRSAAGKFTIFDVPAGSKTGTAAFSINRFGVTAGSYLDATHAFHGFSRLPGGKLAMFDAPGAGAGAGQGTRSSTNNIFGEVAGWWIDAAGLNHGFVWSNCDLPGAGKNDR